MTGEDSKHIEVIGQFPIHPVGLAVRTQIGWIDEEHYTGHIFVLLKHLLVIAGSDCQTVEIICA